MFMPTGLKRQFALCMTTCIGTLSLAPSIAAACEGGGGGGEGKIQTTPEPPVALKFSGKTNKTIKVQNTGTAPVEFVSKEITFNSAKFKIVKKCESFGVPVKELAVGATCESTVEHTTTEKGNLGTWTLKWKGGGLFEEKSRVELESIFD